MTVVEIPVKALPQIKTVQFVAAGELIKCPTPIDWLIKGILQTDSMNTLIGAPGCFKSNLAVDMAASIATGIDWHGRRTKHGAVFCVAGEGHNGLARRLKAWSIVRGADLGNAPLFISMGAVGLVEPLTAAAVSEEVSRLASLTGMQPALVVVDTLARNFGAGDENSASDMGRFISISTRTSGSGSSAPSSWCITPASATELERAAVRHCSLQWTPKSSASATARRKPSSSNAGNRRTAPSSNRSLSRRESSNFHGKTKTEMRRRVL